MTGHAMSEVMTPRNTGPQPGSKRYDQMVSDLKQLKAELESVPLSQLGTQLDELMGTTPRNARGPNVQHMHIAAAPRAADVRGRRGPNGQFFCR